MPSDENATPEEMAAFRQSSIYPYMPLLKKNVLHRTSQEGMLGIYESGFIEPNRGQFPYSYPQSKTYYGPRNDYVCLFDFESARESDYASILSTWQQFFFNFEPETVVIVLDRAKLPKLIPSSIIEGERGYIPYVEVWYPERIPLTVAKGLFTIPNK